MFFGPAAPALVPQLVVLVFIVVVQAPAKICFVLATPMLVQNKHFNTISAQILIT
jgi:hypothetical protein